MLRAGRTTSAQQLALASLGPRYCIDYRPEPLDLDATFGRTSPKILEIGFGMGETTAKIAAAHPQNDYLGIEVHPPGVGALLRLIEQSALTNVRIVQHDAVEVVQHMITPGALDAIHVFFPDPWPKKRHHKRRLVQPPFVAELARVLKRGGFLHVATDWADYARHTREVLASSDRFTAIERTELAGEPLAIRPPTKFERRGVRLGHDVADLYYRSL